MSRLGAAPSAAPVVAQAGPRGGAGGRGGRGGYVTFISNGTRLTDIRPRGGRGGNAPGGRGPRRGPANEGDLDKELDSFMTGGADSAGASAPAAADVDMS